MIRGEGATAVTGPEWEEAEEARVWRRSLPRTPAGTVGAAVANRKGARFTARREIYFRSLRKSYGARAGSTDPGGARR